MEHFFVGATCLTVGIENIPDGVIVHIVFYSNFFETGIVHIFIINDIQPLGVRDALVKFFFENSLSPRF